MPHVQHSKQMITPQHTITRLAILFSTLLLTACTDDISDLEALVTEAKSQHPGSIEPIPPFELYQAYSYTATKERDPFIEKIKQNFEGPATTTDDTQPDRERRKEPLEYFPMDSLRMVGILEQPSNTWGLIKDPNGAIHPVKPGNHLGENFGEITRITEQHIEVLEIIPDGLGTWVERETSLRIGEQSEKRR